MTFPKKVKIVEVGPRDGLQNEKKIIPTRIKMEFINRLSQTGLSVIEATSFVSPQWIPQLADHSRLFAGIKKKKGVSYPVLVPNLSGLKQALDVKVKEIAVFTSPSETFCRHNINCSVKESIDTIANVIQLAKQHKVRVRGYLSCVLGCPYEGKMAPRKVAALAEQLFKLGCYEISLGDTIGVGTPLQVQRLLETVLKKVPLKYLAVHFHDTYGQALANIYAALALGIQTVDSSVAGLGGCPYAPGAAGNVATEELVYLLAGMGIKTGVNLKKLLAAGRFISRALGRVPPSKVSLAMP